MGLTFSNLTAPLLQQLKTNNQFITISNFISKTLGEGAEFAVVLQGSASVLPASVQSNGNYILLNRPDLVNKELFVYFNSATSSATVGNYALANEPPMVAAPVPKLQIAPGGSNTVILSWPASAFGYSPWYETRLSQNGCQGHTQCPEPVPTTNFFTVGSTNFLAVPMEGPTEFYMLKSMTISQ